MEITGRSDFSQGNSNRVARRTPKSELERNASRMHKPKDLDFEPIGHREECWARLSPRLRERLTATAGEVLAWWAQTLEDGSSSAVILGERALVWSERRILPTHDGVGRPVHALPGFQLDPLSLRRVSVNSPAARGDETQGQIAKHPTKVGPPSEFDLQLSAQARGVLGNLPEKAQQLLQEPFSGTRPIEKHLWHYWGDANSLEYFAFILAGGSTLTFAVGEMYAPIGGGRHEGMWKLECGLARIVARMSI